MSKKSPYGSFYEDEQLLDSGISIYFTLFGSEFVDMTPGNHNSSWVETTNSKALLFIVVSSTFLIKHEIFDPEKGTTKVIMSKLWSVYCISSIQIHFLFTKQILQSWLRVEDNKSSFIFCDKSYNAILLATSNLWDNIQIVRTHIVKYNIFNPISLIIRHLDFETLHHYFEHVSGEVMYYVLNKDILTQFL